MLTPSFPQTSSLLQRIQAGGIPSRRAENELYDQYHYMVRLGQRKFNLPTEDASMAYHQAITSLVQSIRLNKFRGESSLKTYLFRAFRNQCINCFQKLKRSPTEDALDDHLGIAAGSPDPYRQLDNHEIIRQVKLCLTQLNEKAAAILWGSAWDGYSSRELAQQHGIKNAATVDVLKSRYRKQLLALMKPYRKSA